MAMADFTREYHRSYHDVERPNKDCAWCERIVLLEEIARLRGLIAKAEATLLNDRYADRVRNALDYLAEAGEEA